MVIKYNGDVIPCCNYRIGEQYDRTKKPVVLGNVFETGVMGVWNQEGYQMIRRGLKKVVHMREDSFCYGCSLLFNTNSDELTRPADRYRYEDLYSADANGVTRIR